MSWLSALPRALGRGLAWPVRRIARTRLRTKLALALSVAALLPMLVVASLASGVVLGSLDRGLQRDVERQLAVGLNLTLRAVERQGVDAVELAGHDELAAAVGQGEAAVREVLARAAPYLPSSVVQVFAADGRLLATEIVGGDAARFAELAVDGRAATVTAGLAWSRRVTFELSAKGVVVRAVAPIVGRSLRLSGAVVVSVPLDGDFADSIKGALGVDVLVGGLNAGVATSTVRDRDGRRLSAVQVPTGVLQRVRERRQPVETLAIAGREHAVAWTALVDDRGRAVGLFAVAIDRRSLSRAQRVAFRSLAIGAAVALVFALGLAALLTRRVGRPIATLHRGAIAIARGELDQVIDVPAGDEIGDLAAAFAQMTAALKENQQRLAARMREMVAIHDAGRAMSSVIEFDQVSAKVVESIARVFEVRLCALFAVTSAGRADEPRVAVAAARVRRSAPGASLIGVDPADAAPLAPIASQVARLRATLRIDDASADPRRRDAALAAGIDGSLLATPLERKGAVVGVLVVGRTRQHRPFLEADANLLATFADQAAAAVENARLYAQVRDASEELEAKVRLRTAELTAINAELGRALADLRDTQAQLVLSERMAGLGLLVAGVAHEINSPSAAIRGAVEGMTAAIGRIAHRLRDLIEALPEPAARAAVVAEVEDHARRLAEARMPTGAAVRRAARELRGALAPWGEAAIELAPRLAEAGADPGLVARLGGAVPPVAAPALVAYLVEYADVHRSSLVIGNAIVRIQRIVGALKTYSHLDEEPTRVATDLHEGIETTLTLMAYSLRDITVVRRFAQLPSVPIFVDELNQVWTNLIQNAVQACAGKGTIAIETALAEPDGVVVRVVDDGPGIPADIQPRIFEPFFTTKPKGEGTGLGLGIVAQIVAKHAGRVRCESAPGRTMFEVWLPRRAAPVVEVIG
ncbi:MAG: GAF domain-containing protein [Kofleriaceae bacterium]|jgi:two-component system NtrC family sensor kinase|nr:GAF domain-containing protein [Kofleriaceae bacterium]MBP9165883.1 GAF domain-containing protein [Kofleriaceae bacterium]